jgi:hypothetical protein
MEATLVLAGLGCLAAAIAGGGLKGFGLEVPVLQSHLRQLALGILGLALVAVGRSPGLLAPTGPAVGPTAATAATAVLAGATAIRVTTAAPATSAPPGSARATPAGPPATLTAPAPAKAAVGVPTALAPASPDANAITPGGPPVHVTTGPGQEARLRFEGRAGQRVSVAQKGQTAACPWLVYLQGPDGQRFTQLYGNCGFMDGTLLPQDGAYALVVAADPTSRANVTLTLYDVVDPTADIVPGGPPVRVTTTVPGQTGRLLFAGRAGQRVRVVQQPNATVCPWLLYLLEPDGQRFTQLYGGCQPLSATLPTDGEYTVVVNPEGMGTADVTVTLNDVG